MYDLHSIKPAQSLSTSRISVLMPTGKCPHPHQGKPLCNSRKAFQKLQLIKMKMCGTQSRWIQQQHNSYTQGSGTTGKRKQDVCKILPVKEEIYHEIVSPRNVRRRIHAVCGIGAECMLDLLAMGDRPWVSLAGPSPKHYYILPP